MGESVSEATVAKWLKKVGDAVKMDEPLVELETDKVTLEVNATTTGVISEIKAPQGSNVGVGAILGLIQEGAAAVSSPSASATTAAPAKSPVPVAANAPTYAKASEGSLHFFSCFVWHKPAEATLWLCDLRHR